MEKQFYYSIPNEIIYSDPTYTEYDLLTYVAISKCKLLYDSSIAHTSIFDICSFSNYSTIDRKENSYLSSIRCTLKLFKDNELIRIDGIKETDELKIKALIKMQLTDKFTPTSNYTVLTNEELSVIIGCKEYKATAALLKVYLYIKSLMFIDYNNPNSSISAYYVTEDIACQVLFMSKQKYDICVNTLCALDLLICHQTGSYYDFNGIKNAPNIYVLNNDNVASNIRGALNRLKHDLLKPEFGNKDDFMPIVYTGKKIKKSE